MKEKEEIWKAYTSAWSESDKEKRLSMLKKILEQNCLYQDPNNSISGITKLSHLMGLFQESVPGGYFSLQEFKSHHDKSLAKWALIKQSGEKVHEGISYGLYSKDNKLQQMTGFFF